MLTDIFVKLISRIMNGAARQYEVVEVLPRADYRLAVCRTSDGAKFVAAKSWHKRKGRAHIVVIDRVSGQTVHSLHIEPSLATSIRHAVRP